jgi:hypothetical protein
MLAKDDRKSEKNHSREDEFKPGGRMPTPRNFRRRARGELLLFNPLYRIAKADGDAPVQAYIAAMPGWKRNVGRPRRAHRAHRPRRA